MRIACLVVGTRGDIVPVVSLARHLAAVGHAPVMATSHDHRAFVEANGLAFSPLSPSYADEIARAGEALGAGERQGAGLLRARMVEASTRWAAEGMAAIDGAGLIVGVATSMGAVADALGEARRIPVVHAHLMPLVPSAHVPPPLPPPPRRALPGPANLALFRSMRLLVWRACFADAVAGLRRALGLAPLPWSGRRPAVPTLCAWSPSLLAPPPDWDPALCRVTGDWHPGRFGAGPAFVPDAALDAFLSADPPPVHVGFGSMRIAPRGRDALAAAIGAGLERAGARAAIGGGLLEQAGLADRQDGRTIRAGDAPYRWLFPRVSVAVHHGGAGGTHDAMRAGVPQVIVPFVVDQFLWARQLHARGVAPWRLSRTRPDADAFARAIETAHRMRGAAVSLAERAAAEDGVADAVSTLERWGMIG